jgi:hypothetical protein
MAGDWIKMRCNLWDDPRVSSLCDITGVGEATIVGGLYWLWSTADQHSANGILPGLSARTLDRKCGVPGLGAALVQVGWLVETPDGLHIMNFNDHNGASAKSRAQTARRVANHKAGNAEVTPEALPESDSGVSEALPREEKRREEVNNKKNKQKKPPAAPSFDPAPALMMLGVEQQTVADWLALRKAKRAPVSKVVLDNFLREAGAAGMSLDAVLALCCTRGWVGFEAAWVLRDRQQAGTGAAQRFDPTAHVNRNRPGAP